MATVNLLPTDISPKGPIVKLSNLLKNLAAIFFAIFLFAAFGMVAMFILNNAQIKDLEARSEQLKTSIRSLETTEQSLILVKDRIGKAKTALALESGKDETEGMGIITSGLPVGATLSEAVVSKDSLVTTFIALDSGSLANLMAIVISQETFKNVELVSFSFNPNSGYVPSFSMRINEKK